MDEVRETKKQKKKNAICIYQRTFDRGFCAWWFRQAKKKYERKYGNEPKLDMLWCSSITRKCLDLIIPGLQCSKLTICNSYALHTYTQRSVITVEDGFDGLFYEWKRINLHSSFNTCGSISMPYFWIAFIRYFFFFIVLHLSVCGRACSAIRFVSSS